LTELEYLESTFFKVLGDLKEYLDDLTLVGGWLSYVYAKYVWGNLAIKPVTTADIDFGLGTGETRVYPRTIFELFSSLDYKPKFCNSKIYPKGLRNKIRRGFCWFRKVIPGFARTILCTPSAGKIWDTPQSRSNSRRI